MRGFIPKIGIFVPFGPGLAGLFGWWLWRAGCISQDTYLLYNYFHLGLSIFLFTIAGKGGNKYKGSGQSAFRGKKRMLNGRLHEPRDYRDLISYMLDIKWSEYFSVFPLAWHHHKSSVMFRRGVIGGNIYFQRIDTEWIYSTRVKETIFRI